MAKKWTQEELDRLIVKATTDRAAWVNAHEQVRIDRINPYKVIPMEGRTWRLFDEFLHQLVNDPNMLRGDCEGCELIDYGMFKS